MRFLTSVAAAAALTACSTTAGLAPETATGGFEDAKTVKISEHGNACTSMVCTSLGAQWSGKHPADAILMVAIVNDIKAITGAQLNIDGQITTLPATAGVTAFSHIGAMKSSTKGFAVPLETIRAITSAKRVWLRVLTPTGYLEDAVVDGATDSKALHALKRFLIAVDASS